MLRRLSPLLFVGLLFAEGVLAPATDAAARPLADAPPVAEAARELSRPPAPTGSYRPRFVHQTQNNCAFASAVMLVDKWTGGKRRPEQQKLRAASGVPSTEGVGMSELARAMERATKLRILWSPGGGDPLTWDGLMSRLAKGGAAVVAGAYSRLPGHYTRWNRAYAALGAAASGHAVYVERYEPGRHGGRVWIMDPLAVGRYNGEWISANDLKAFAWRNSKGLVHAVATPEPPTLAGYEFGTPSEVDPGTAVAGGQVSISIPLQTRSGWSRPDDLALSVVWNPETIDPDPEDVAAAYLADVAALRAEREREAEAAESGRGKPDRRAGEGAAEASHEAAPALDDDVSPAALDAWRLERAAEEARQEEADAAALAAAAVEEAPSDKRRPAKSTKPLLVPLTARKGALVANLRAPNAAGTWRLEMAIRHRSGREFEDPPAPALADVSIALRGPMSAVYGEARMPDQMLQGTHARLSLVVGNVGSAKWRGDDALRLVASWEAGGDTWHAASAPVSLRSGERDRIALDVIVPTKHTKARLHVGLVTAAGVPLSEFGIEPVVIELELERRSEGEPGPTQDSAFEPSK